MSRTIAIAGKGGVGKTTISGLLIQYLCDLDKGPVLAVDADANANLNEVLGEKFNVTLGRIREEIVKSEFSEVVSIQKGITKQQYMDCRFSEALIEAEKYDMIVMGRTQGEGCYCYVNSILKNQIQKYSKNYKYIVVDNEAGMEHISRGIMPNIDEILLVSDCSNRSIQTVARIAQLVKDLGIKTKGVKLIVNRVPEGVLSTTVLKEIEKNNLDLIGVIPHDNGVYTYDSEGMPICDLPKDSPVKIAIRHIANQLKI